MKRIGAFFRFVFRRRQLEDELDEELRCHFDLLVDRYTARGMTPDEARRAARMDMEGVEVVKENVRDSFAGAALANFSQDLRYGWRSLRKTPSFAAVAIATLALGIGVNTAIFSVFYAVLVRLLPFDHPQQLALVWSNFEKTGAKRAVTSGPILYELEHRSRALEKIAAIWVGTGTFTGEGDPELVKVGQVTANFFDTLGAHLAMGRGFIPEEAFGGRPVLILSDGLWRRRFGADPAIVGKQVVFQGRSVTIVGVLPPGFQTYFPASSNVPADVQAYTPFAYNIYENPRTLYFLRVVGRMRPGVTLDQTQRDLDRAAAEIRAAFTEFAEEKVTFTVAGMQDDAVRDIRPAVIALFAGAAFVLLICCANVTNLLLARASDRRREIAVRGALGASRLRIIRQLLAEGMVLCSVAGAIGIALAWAGIHALVRIGPERVTRMEIGLNWPVLLFTACISIGAVTIFGLAPGLQTMKLDLMQTIREAGRNVSAPSRRFGSVLVVVEIMTGLVLVVGGGLMMRTVAKLEQVHPGFVAHNLLTFQVAVRGNKTEGVLVREKEWENRLRALPGVELVGGVSHLPLDDFSNWYSPYQIEGKTTLDAASMLADYRCATPGYLEAMGVRLLAGRYFNDQDRAGGRMVAIVDEMLARTAWPGESAVGKKIQGEHTTNQGFQPVWAEVVGVVEHVRTHTLSQEVRGEIYFPYEQSPRSPLIYAVRTRVDPVSLVGAVRGELHAFDPSLALSKVRPMAGYVEQDIAPVSFTATLAGIFAALALLLAAIGIYGVLYYQVSRRMHEMGVRMALGAGRVDILSLVMREGFLLTASGLALGLIGAAAISGFLRTLIYGVSPADPLTYACAITLLAGAALAGCWRPASRASRANPVDAIRAE